MLLLILCYCSVIMCFVLFLVICRKYEYAVIKRRLLLYKLYMHMCILVIYYSLKTRLRHSKVITLIYPVQNNPDTDTHVMDHIQFRSMQDYQQKIFALTAAHNESLDIAHDIKTDLEILKSLKID